jgi:hypothetical protein
MGDALDVSRVVADARDALARLVDDVVVLALAPGGLEALHAAVPSLACSATEQTVLELTATVAPKKLEERPNIEIGVDGAPDRAIDCNDAGYVAKLFSVSRVPASQAKRSGFNLKQVTCSVCGGVFLAKKVTADRCSAVCSREADRRRNHHGGALA